VVFIVVRNVVCILWLLSWCRVVIVVLVGFDICLCSMVGCLLVLCSIVVVLNSVCIMSLVDVVCGSFSSMLVLIIVLIM